MTSLRSSWLASALALLLVFPLGLSASSVPMLTSAYATSINGDPAIAGALVKTGDTLATNEGVARLAIGATVAELGQHTLVSVESHGLSLQHGYLRVQGALGLVQRTHAAQPLSAGGDYEVTELAGGRTYLHVFSGALAMSGFARPVTVTAGKAILYQDGSQAQDQSQDQSTAPGIPATTSQGGGMPTWTIAALAGAAAAIVIVVLATRSSSSAASPSQ